MHYSQAPQFYAMPNLVLIQQKSFACVCTWIVEARSHRVLCFLAGLWTINIFDLALTLIAYRQGLLHETNPIALTILERGPEAVCLFKCVLVAIGSVILFHYRRRLLAEFTAAGLLLIYTLVAVQWKWCYELYELAHTGGVSNSDLMRVGAWASDLPVL
ncbi:MAG: hypothetical protein KAV82_07945 [Phycisphaerae bacterium]|nr:hypothetical protein [Phycisphaerae bacterium]